MGKYPLNDLIDAMDRKIGTTASSVVTSLLFVFFVAVMMLYIVILTNEPATRKLLRGDQPTTRQQP